MTTDRPWSHHMYFWPSLASRPRRGPLRALDSFLIRQKYLSLSFFFFLLQQNGIGTAVTSDFFFFLRAADLCYLIIGFGERGNF